VLLRCVGSEGGGSRLRSRHPHPSPLHVPPPAPTPQIFPYHLSEYVCRVQRTSPFKYYREVLFLTLRDERSYDTIPNFTVGCGGGGFRG
jgi:hypothetical protein